MVVSGRRVAGDLNSALWVHAPTVGLAHFGQPFVAAAGDRVAAILQVPAESDQIDAALRMDVKHENPRPETSQPCDDLLLGAFNVDLHDFWT